MPRLVAQSAEFAGKSFDLTGGEITVGRVADNNIQLEHASISGHHAVFRLDSLDYVIKDLDSTNGTRIQRRAGFRAEAPPQRHPSPRNIELLYDSEHAPPGRPMPAPSERVNLAECASHGRPPEFANASPIVKRSKGKIDRMWALILSVAGVLALAGIGYFIWVVFVLPPAAA